VSWFSNLFDARIKISDWKKEEYTQERQHSSLGYRTPDEFAKVARTESYGKDAGGICGQVIPISLALGTWLAMNPSAMARSHCLSPHLVALIGAQLHISTRPLPRELWQSLRLKREYHGRLLRESARSPLRTKAETCNIPMLSQHWDFLDQLFPLSSIREKTSVFWKADPRLFRRIRSNYVLMERLVPISLRRRHRSIQTTKSVFVKRYLFQRRPGS
jgi:hypothetical protein